MSVVSFFFFLQGMLRPVSKPSHHQIEAIMVQHVAMIQVGPGELNGGIDSNIGSGRP
jgi:hypothetical protein